MIAQEIREVAPELVHEGEDGILSVAYGNLSGYLIEGVKHLKYENEQLRQELAAFRDGFRNQKKPRWWEFWKW